MTIAVMTGSDDVAGPIQATFRFCHQMFGSASVLQCLFVLEFVPLQKRCPVSQPHRLLAVEATSTLAMHCPLFEYEKSVGHSRASLVLRVSSKRMRSDCSYSRPSVGGLSTRTRPRLAKRDSAVSCRCNCSNSEPLSQLSRRVGKMASE